VNITQIEGLVGQLDVLPIKHEAVDVGFKDIIISGLTKVNDDIQAAKTLSEKYALGEPVPVDQLMISLGQAQLSLKLTVEVKNKLTAAYQELFRMQI
jgi:flagellar hook-basal body complex protein FliE